jgi:Protein of unknown function (DUF2934)
MAKTKIEKPAHGSSLQKEPSDAVVHAPQSGELSADEMIAVSAYFRAERRGFAPGSELADWLDAEAEYGNRVSLNAN